MDVVSDAISAVRVGRPSSDRVRVGGSWCARLDPYDGAGFHIVLKGGCWLLPDGGDPVALGAGDAVLLPHGTGHVIADSPADAATVGRAVSFTRWADGTLPRPALSPLTRARWRCSAASTGSTTAARIRSWRSSRPSCTSRTGETATPNCGPPSACSAASWTSCGPARPSRCRACSTCCSST